MKREVYEQQKQAALDYFEKAHIVLTDAEKDGIEVADYGMDIVNDVGLQLITYVNTQRVCAKEMVLLPSQTCPEHWHVDTDGMQGKEETFRCRYGTVYLYVDGEPKDKIQAKKPGTEVTVFNEIILNEGEQHTLMPYTKHWFQGGPKGAVISEFSTRSTDETDVFTDKRIIRIPVIED